MYPKFCIIVIRFFVFLFVISAADNWCLAQQGANNSSQTTMTLAPGQNGAAAEGTADPRKDLVDRLNLKIYEAAAGNLSLCGKEDHCLKPVSTIKGFLCVDAACTGTDKSKKPFDCFKFQGEPDKYTADVQDKINSLTCYLIKSPSSEIRRELLTYVQGVNEDFLVENGAYLIALKGSEASCERYIKNYVGDYGPQWKSIWYKALSGCRILAGETTREQEEKDFYTWFGVVQGSGTCSDIINSQMREACNAPGAGSPIPSSAKPPAQGH